MTEAKIQGKIMRYLEGLGAYVIKTIISNKNGVTDIIVCLNGLYIGIEAKRPGEEPTKLQKYNIRKVRASGGIAFSADSVNDVITKLKYYKVN